MLPLLQNALKFWPRVADALHLLSMALTFLDRSADRYHSDGDGGRSFCAFVFLALFVLAFQVWIVGRLFVNFLFWQTVCRFSRDPTLETRCAKSKELRAQPARSSSGFGARCGEAFLLRQSGLRLCLRSTSDLSGTRFSIIFMS